MYSNGESDLTVENNSEDIQKILYSWPCGK